MSSLTLSLFAPEAPPPVNPPTTTGPAEWSGAPEDQTLIVTFDMFMSSGEKFAPLAVNWDIRVSNSAVGERPALFNEFDVTHGRIHYVVLTGDTGNYRNDMVAHANHRNKAFEYGQHPGHVYSNPGSYTGYIFAYDDFGKWGVSEPFTFVVTDPDVAIPPARTIVIAPDNDFTGAPSADAANRVTNINDAYTRFAAVRSGGPVRICAKAGQNVGVFTSNTWDQKFAKGRTLFDTWGGSERAIYSERNSGILGAQEFFAPVVYPVNVKNWSFDLGWDVFADAPSNGWDLINARRLYEGKDKSAAADSGGLRMVFDNCDIQGCARAVVSYLSQDRQEDGAVFLNDCLMQRNNDYLAFTPSNLYILGTRVIEEEGVSLNFVGRYRTPGLQRGGKGHRAIRDKSNFRTYIRCFFFEGRGGWTGFEGNGGETLYFPQPLFRLNNSNEGIDGNRRYICDSVIAANMGLIGLGNIAHVVVENCVIMLDPGERESSSLVDTVRGGNVIRNNQMIALNTPLMDKDDLIALGKNPDQFERNNGNMTVGAWTGQFVEFRVEAGGTGGVATGQPIDLLHNTGVCLRTNANLGPDGYTGFNRTLFRFGRAQSFGDVSTLYDYTGGHNVEYAPRLSPAVGPAMSTVDMENVRVLNVWMKWHWVLSEFVLQTAVGPSQQTPLIPYPFDWTNTQLTQAHILANTTGNHALKCRNSLGTLRSYATLAQTGFEGNGFKLPNQVFEGASFDFQPTGFVITNTSADTWAGSQTLSILIERGNGMASDRIVTVDNSELKLYRPTTPQALTPGVRSTLFDLARNLRPNAGFAISPTSGTNAAGALLPA